MEKIVIHKNKGEVFDCQLKVDGASLKDTTVRLCLEFKDNKNLFFYGKVNENGNCHFDLPKLKDIENEGGKFIIEAIADSVYFRLYEAEFELKNSVEVNLIKNTKAVKEAKITLEDIQTKPVEVIEETKTNPFLPRKKKPGFSNYFKDKNGTT